MFFSHTYIEGCVKLASMKEVKELHKIQQQVKCTYTTLTRCMS